MLVSIILVIRMFNIFWIFISYNLILSLKEIISSKNKLLYPPVIFEDVNFLRVFMSPLSSFFLLH